MYSLLLLNIHVHVIKLWCLYVFLILYISFCLLLYIVRNKSCLIGKSERVVYVYLRNRTLQSKYKYTVINLIRGYAITRYFIECALSVSFIK